MLYSAYLFSTRIRSLFSAGREFISEILKPEFALYTGESVRVNLRFLHPLPLFV